MRPPFNLEAELYTAEVDRDEAYALLMRTVALLLSALRVIDAVTLAPPLINVLQGRTLGEITIAVIRAALVKTHGSQKETARLLDISPRQLHYQLRTLNPHAYEDLLPFVRPQSDATKARKSRMRRTRADRTF